MDGLAMKTYEELPTDGGSDVLGQVTSHVNRLRRRMESVRHTVAICSGKGGVGKSSITANLAGCLALNGRRVGIVDADINGPSIARMTGVSESKVEVAEGSVRPVLSSLGVRVTSMDLLLPAEETPVIWNAPTQKDAFTWRGTMEMTALREFISDTDWGELDYLLIDLPPGTDRLPNLVDLLPSLGGTIIVTIPSGVSQMVVKKSLSMAKEFLKTPVIGIIENMSDYLCADCGKKEELFPSGHSEQMAEQFGVSLLGKVPFDPRLSLCADSGSSFLEENRESPAARTLFDIAKGIETFFED